MGSRDPWIVPLAEAADCEDELVGGKTAKLAQLRRAGFPVPNGFCVTTRAYERFVAETGLAKYVAMELGRKSLDGMRWEEIWDTALRIRSEFLRAEIPDAVSEAIGRAGRLRPAVGRRLDGRGRRRGAVAGAPIATGAPWWEERRSRR